MTDESLLAQLDRSPVVRIGEQELAHLLSEGEIVMEENTGMAGPIRLLVWNRRFLFQEETPERQLLLRQMPSKEAAEQLVRSRLATYERMWDGCGCHIDYFGEDRS
ncbi:MAG: hypothetical protein ACP5VF_01785 [Acidobacteriota bacterium]